VAEGLGVDVAVGGPAPDPGDDAGPLLVVALEGPVADAGEDDPTEALGLAGGQLEDREGAEGEPDRVDGAVLGEDVDQPAGEVVVGGGSCGLGAPPWPRRSTPITVGRRPPAAR
jgi:hypothetical protein